MLWQHNFVFSWGHFSISGGKQKLEINIEEKNQTFCWKEPVAGLCSQIQTVLSPLQEASTAGTPLTPVAGFHATPQTLSVWPSSRWISLSSKFSSAEFIARKVNVLRLIINSFETRAALTDGGRMWWSRATNPVLIKGTSGPLRVE